jgi:hypothetical protein
MSDALWQKLMDLQANLMLLQQAHNQLVQQIDARMTLLETKVIESKQTDGSGLGLPQPMKVRQGVPT